MSMSIDQAFEHYPNIGRERLALLCNISEHEARIQCRMHKGKRMDDSFKIGVAIGDIHYPYHNNTVNICKEFVRANDVDYFLFMGDQMHFDMISTFNMKKPKLKEGSRLKRDYRGFQRLQNSFLDLLPKTCERYWFMGNHEMRTYRLVESQPELEGMVEPENCLDLKDWKVVPENNVITLGDMNFIHGIYWNKYHATKNVQDYGKQIFNWHVHTHQVFTMHSPVDSLPKQGVSIGCACDVNPEYMRDKPNSWVNQFLIFYLFDDGSFTYYAPIVLNNRCVIDGKVYKG